jgi:drug/metabolite transporter (DMT)-like permease
MFFDFSAVLFGFLSAIFFSLYHLFLSTSYIYADVSLIYPVTTSSPLLVVIWAKLFLDEKITLFGLLGIFIITVGVIIMHLTKIKGSIDNKGFLYALLAAFFYSIGSIIDKFGVSIDNFILYIYSLVFFMTLILAAQANLRFNNHINHFIKNKKYVLFGGSVIFLSFLTYRLGLTYMQVSYATSLRQVNAIFGVIISAFLLKEHITFKRIVGTLIIFIGAFLIKFSL